MLLKVNRKILVLFRLVQNFEIFDLAMAKVEKVNIAVTYAIYCLFHALLYFKEFEVLCFLKSGKQACLLTCYI